MIMFKAIAFVVVLVISHIATISAGKGCGANRFSCKDGACILASSHCDGDNDCGDNSDEEGCQAAGCKMLRRFHHGKKRFTGARTSSGYSVGSSVHYRCKKWYKLIGSERRFCREGGKWDGFRAHCIRKNDKRRFCKIPSAPQNGTMTGRKLSKKSWIRYSCDENFKLVGPTARKCRSNGRWSGDGPSCEPTSCDDPGYILNGKRVGSGFSIGSSILYICNSGYEMVGEKYITCFRDVSWSVTPPKCVKEDEALQYRAGELNKNFINKLKLITADGQGRSGLESSAQGLDLVFVVDYSESVGKGNFEKAIDFVKSLIQHFGLSATPEGTHVAVVVYSDKPKLIFNLKSLKIYKKKTALDQLKNLNFPGGGTATRLALDMVIYQIRNETRPPAKKVLFLITDGNYNVGGDPASSAKQLREKLGFTIYTVGISNFISRENLEDIASLPFSKHIYLVKDFNMLEKLKNLVASSTTDYTSCGMGDDTQTRSESKTAKETKSGAWPWTVGINTGHTANGRPIFCSGSILSTKWVVTAASCLKGAELDNVRVTAGMHSRAKATGSEQVKRAESFHFNSAKVKGRDIDIALIKLKEEFKFNEYTRAVCLPAKFDFNIFVRPQKTAYVVGWGLDSSVSLVQIQGNVKFTSNKGCRTEFRNVTGNNICVKNLRDSNAVCAGSIGSPLMVHRTRDFNGNRKIYSWVLVGVLLRNDGCQKKKNYSVFTQIEYVKEWLLKTMKEHSR